MNKIYVQNCLLNVLVKALLCTAGKSDFFFGRNSELLMHTEQGSDVLTVRSRADMGPGRVFCTLSCVKTIDLGSCFTISIESLNIGLNKLGCGDVYNMHGCFEFDKDSNIFLFSAIDESFFKKKSSFDDLNHRGTYMINTAIYDPSVEYISGDIAVGDFKFSVHSEMVSKLEQIYGLAKLATKTSKLVILFHFSASGLVLELQSDVVMASVKLLDRYFENETFRAMGFEAFRSLKDVLTEFKKVSLDKSCLLVTEGWFTIEYSPFYVQLPLLCLSEMFLKDETLNFADNEVEFGVQHLKCFVNELKISKALSDEFATLHFDNQVLHGYAAREINSYRNELPALNFIEIDSALFEVRRDLLAAGLVLLGLKSISIAGFERSSKFLKLSSKSTDNYLIIGKMPIMDDD